MKNILVVYYWISAKMRETVKNHLLCFREYTDRKTFNVTYLNLAYQRLPESLAPDHFDLIIFHTLFATFRNTTRFDLFDNSTLKRLTGIKAIMPQDEHVRCDDLCDFAEDFGVSHIYSVAAETEWPVFYGRLDPAKVQVHRILTGYLSDDLLEKAARYQIPFGERELDIGYRSRDALPSQGRHGRLKPHIAELFLEKATERGLNADISVGEKGTFYGDSWYRFIANCRFFPGVEGGASILDRDGSIRTKTVKFMQENPLADFDTVEAACFPGLDGKLNYFAISPRHLEACAFRVCQVLIEGDYNGMLTKDVHYLELKKDFSNIEEVLDQMEDRSLVETLAENAYRDIVLSGKYTYEKMVSFILQTSLGESL